MNAVLRDPARSLGGNTAFGVTVTFAEAQAMPAFLRLPVVLRYGKPETHGFRLTDIPLPLSEGG